MFKVPLLVSCMVYLNLTCKSDDKRERESSEPSRPPPLLLACCCVCVASLSLAVPPPSSLQYGNILPNSICVGGLGVRSGS
jgi:hypothetical protein